MFKNVAGQKLTVYVFDPSTGLPETGDAANLTAYVSLDDGTVTALTDTSAAEKDATNAAGYYTFDLSQAETNADKLDFSGKSSTSGLVVVASPPTVYTRPANFSTFAIDGSGRVDVGELGGDAQSLTDLKDFADAGYDPSTNRVSADAVAISGDTTAADKLEAKLDRTIYVNHDGNDTTSGTTLHNTIEGASAGSVVSIGPGRFYFGTANITIPDDVSVIGSGRGITRLASGEQGALSGARIKPGDRSYLADFTFDGSETLAGGVAYEYPVGYDTDYDDPFVDAIMERVDVYGSTDAVFLSGSSESDACSLKCVNCRIFSVFDIAFAAGANKRLELIDCDIWGDYNGDYGEDRTFLKASNGGLLIARNCRLRDASASGQAIGAHALNSGSKIYVENSRFDLFNTGDLHAEAEDSGAIEFAACQYDSAKVSTATSGTFAVAPLATELAAINAAVEAGQVGTDATEMLTRVPDATPGANGGLPTVDANNRIAGIQGTLTTLDALDTAQDAQHSSTQASVGAISTEVDNLGVSLLTIDNNVDSALADTNELQGLFTTGGTLRLLYPATTIAAAGDQMTLEDDAITSAKFDGSTAAPLSATQAAYIDASIAGISLGSNPNVLLTAEIATVNSQTEFTLASGADFDDAYNGQTIVRYDNSNNDFPSVGVITDYVGATKTVTTDGAPAFTLAADDSVAIFATAPGTTAPTAETVATAVRSELTTELGRIDAAVSTRSTLDAAGVRTAVGLGSANLDTQLAGLPTDSDVQTAAAAALSSYDPPTKAELDAAVSPLATSAALATVDGNVDSILVDTGTTLPGILGTPADTIAADIAGIEAGSGLDAAGVRAAIGMASANLDDQLNALPTAAENAAAVLTGEAALGFFANQPAASVTLDEQAIEDLVDGLVAAGAVAAPVDADVVDDSRTWFATNSRATNIVTVNATSGPLTFALKPDLNPGTTISAVTSVTITGAATVVAEDLSTNRGKDRAHFTAPALTTTGSYTVKVTVTTVDDQTIVTTGTLRVE